MTKKNFIDLADYLRKPGMIHARVEQAIIDQHQASEASDGIFRDLPQAKLDALTTAIMAGITEELADFCHAQASGFDRERFIDYAMGKRGPNGGKL